MSRSEWPRGLRSEHVYVAAPLLGVLVRIPPGAWMSVVSVVCCKVEVSASNRTHPEDSHRVWRV